MGIRFRRSVKIAPGVRLSVSKTGFGVSAGVRGARYSVHSSGRRTTSLGIPGTGLSYVETSSTGRRRSAGRSAQPVRTQVMASGAQAAAVLPKAGWFAGPAEKQYRAGLVAYLTGRRPEAAQAFEAVLDADPKIVSAHLFAALSTDAETELDRITRHLEAVVTSSAAFPDRLLVKFLPPHRSSMGLDIKITELISARLPFDRAAASMLLAEAYQERGRLEEAIGLVQQLHDADPSELAIRLSLADLLFADKDYDGVVELAGAVRNDDDISLSLIHLRAAALMGLGHHTSALDSFKDALAKSANRDPDLLAAIRYDRALAFDQLGQRVRSRADFERLYAADPDYRDVRELLGGTTDRSRSVGADPTPSAGVPRESAR